MAFATPRKLIAALPRLRVRAAAPLRVECIRFAALPGAPGNGRAPVRIFLGTEAGQQRAERVFLWSVQRVRDPAREYQVYLMRDLPGFDRRRWVTGFTNYRFAVPALCEGAGRAIYNDVDQIYLSDPAGLFDLPMDGYGVLALSAHETSVMLLDCARLAPVWPLARARRGARKGLEARAGAIAGLVGPLPARWHARDEEYAPGEHALVHYTTLHTQPWQPFPEQYVYQPSPVGELWHALEREADADGYEVHTVRRPSAAFAALRAAGSRAAGNAVPGDAGSVTLLPGAGRVGLLDDAANLEQARIAPAVRCAGALEYLPDADLPWVVEWLFRHAGRSLTVRVDECAPALRVGGHTLRAGRRGLEGWGALLGRHAARHRAVAWTLELRARAGGRVRELRRSGGALPGGPRLWVLDDGKPGHLTQALGLAGALGWPYAVHALRFRPRALALENLRSKLGFAGRSLRAVRRAQRRSLAPPWPDAVLLTGWRSLAAARWVARQSGGHTRVVALGRRASRPGHAFDVAVSAGYHRLPWQPRRVRTLMPINRAVPERLAAARERWAELGRRGAPRVVALIGGSTRRYRLDAAVAADLAARLRALHARLGGTLGVVVSRRTGAAATEALRRALHDIARIEPWPPAGENPYLGYLAWADHFVVTGESESMLAEAASTGKPIHIFPLPGRPAGTFDALGEALVQRATRTVRNRRGTPRPQQGLEYLCARLLERGLLAARRDLTELHRDLVAARRACYLGDPPPAPQGGLDEAPAVAQRVRALLGLWSADEVAPGGAEYPPARLRQDAQPAPNSDPGACPGPRSGAGRHGGTVP